LTEDDLFDPDRKQPPRFVTQIKEQLTLTEMAVTKFECQLAPVGDPNMKVEWFFNGKPLLHSKYYKNGVSFQAFIKTFKFPAENRFQPIYDFGYVAMNFGWVYPEDSGLPTSMEPPRSAATWSAWTNRGAKSRDSPPTSSRCRA